MGTFTNVDRQAMFHTNKSEPLMYFPVCSPKRELLIWEERYKKTVKGSMDVMRTTIYGNKMCQGNPVELLRPHPRDLRKTIWMEYGINENHCGKRSREEYHGLRPKGDVQVRHKDKRTYPKT